MSDPLLEVRDVSKAFPGVQALDGVSLRLHQGEVLAVIGENGAGKSTLMRILGGVHQPDRGTLLLDGQPIHLANVAAALRQGISLIHQELNLAENLSVAANLFLGREFLWAGPLALLDHRRMRAAAGSLMQQVGLTCTPDTLVGDLPPGQRQLVEIARALSLRVRILIMDEPTSSLFQRETERLYAVVADLKQRGVAVVYISHRLAEVRQVADRVAVLRDGRNAGELLATDSEGITHDAMVRLMVGRDLKQFFHKQHAPVAAAEARLEIQDIRYQDGPRHAVSFEVRRGEILGMAGLVGAGRTELAEALFGLRRVTAGAVLLDGKPVHLRSPRQALAAGLVLAPEDRRHHGLLLEDSVQHNIGLPNLDRLSVCGLVRRGREAALAQGICGQLRVRTPSLAQLVGLLSGGNQQKVVLGKWLARRPRVLIVDEPTRGVDVGAKSEIYTLLDELAREGVAILMISSDLEEIIGVSDRVVVLHEGRLTGTLRRAELSEETIMNLATGGGQRS